MLQILVAIGILQAGTPDPRRIVQAAERDAGSGRAPAASGADRAGLLRAATVARLRDDQTAAQATFGRILTVDSTDALALYARLGLAESQRTNRSLELAATTLEAALREADRLHDAAAAAEALVTLALVRSRMLPLDSALTLLRLAEPLADRGDDALRARFHCVRGPIRVDAGQAGAEADARLGLALARRAGSPGLESRCWRALGQWMFANVDDTASAVPFDSAEVVAERSGDRTALAEALVSSGVDRLSFFKDEMAKADLLRAGRVARQAGNRLVEGWSRTMLGRLLARTGDYPAAAIEYAAADSLLVLVGDRARLVELHWTQALASMGLGRLESVLTSMQGARATADSLHNVMLGFMTRSGVMLAHSARGEWVAADSAMEETRRFSQANRLSGFLDGQRYGAGVIALRLGRLDQAEREFRSYLRPGHPEGAFARYVSRSRLAEVYLRRGSLDRAERELIAATTELDSLRSALSDRDLRTLVFQSGSQWEEPDYGLATMVAALVRAGRVTSARWLVEQRRARELADRLVRAGSTTSGKKRPEPQIREDFAATLPADLAVVEYVTGRRGQPTTVFLTTTAGTEGRILAPVDSLEPDLRRFIALLRAGGPVESLARDLGKALLGPVLTEVPASVNRLLIVPDGALHAIPFEALAMSDGEPLLIRFAVASAPSAGVAAELAARPRPIRAARVLAFGDPRFGNEISTADTAEAGGYRSAFESSGGLPRLVASAAEAKAAGRFGAGSVVLLRALASEANLKRLHLTEFSVIHFATHALVSDWSPSRTALALAPGGGEDGFVGPGELASLRLTADLVVLSACRTAGGVVVGGEGLQGLTAPLLEAGARSVVATLWPVRDRPTGRLMRTFYAELAGGSAVAEALRRAKLEAYRAGVPAGEWAAFTLVGDPSVRIEMRPVGSPWWPWVLAGLAAAALGYRVMSRSRRMAEAT